MSTDGFVLTSDFLHSDVVKTTQLDSLIESNKESFRKIKAHLNVMKNDIADSESKNPYEPETRVKRTMHRTYATKFKDVLRAS